MKDRRARIRPRDGARQLYYGNEGLVNTQGGTNLFDPNLPWIASKPMSELAANVPNFISSSVENAVDTVNQQINNAIGGISNRINNSTGSQPGQVGNQIPSGNILYPLAQTDGLVFPYTPIIGYSQTVSYNSYDPVHSNQEFLAYTRTNAPQITCAGEFAVQNEQEASYALACIHFLRTITKMSFGQNSQNAGTPPPIVLFSGYGEYMFNDLPVILQGFDVTFENSVDYVQVPNTTTYIPTRFTVSTVMTVQNTPERQRQFNTQQFRSGQLLKNGGWI